MLAIDAAAQELQRGKVGLLKRGVLLTACRFEDFFGIAVMPVYYDIAAFLYYARLCACDLLYCAAENMRVVEPYRGYYRKLGRVYNVC